MPYPLAKTLRQAVDSSLTALATHPIYDLPHIPHCEEILHPALGLLQRGKRLRPLAAGAGWLCVSPLEEPPEELIALGCALELYQASALVHDDIIDNAATRRGIATIHEHLAATHRNHNWEGNPLHYGYSGALLAGDLLLSLADAFIADIAHTTHSHLLTARWAAMTSEVALGQYLDIRNENAPLDPAQAREEILAVLTYKSARYSAVHPTVLGMLAAGGKADHIRDIEAITHPWGLAFQLRDDDLGIFGDPTHTGKPSGDDLREGKRTLLLALTFEKASAAENAFIHSHIGTPDMTETDIAEICAIIEKSGARAEHERLIDSYSLRGYQALARATWINSSGREALDTLGEWFIHRHA